MKRNGGLLLVPVIAGVMWWLVRDSQLQRGVVLWMPTVQGIGYTLAVAGPLVAALASWGASRSHRRGMTDLIGTAPLPGGWSVVAEWLSVVFWALVAFLGSATVALLWTATETTWGRPLLAPIAIAAVALAVCAAVGTVLGNLWPNRFLPPLLAIVVAALIVAPTGVMQLERIRMLSPMGPIDSMVREPLVRVDDRVVLPHLAWLTALGLTLLLALIALRTGSWGARGLVVVGVLAAVVSGGQLVGGQGHPEDPWGDPPFAHGPLPYKPACATATVTVCVHPAFEMLHGEAAAAIDLIVQPLTGVDGVPTRFEQSMGWRRPETAASVSFDIWVGQELERSLGFQVPMEIVTDYEAMAERQGDAFGQMTAVQAIVAAWLTQEYERRSGTEFDGQFMAMDPGATDSLVPISMVDEGQPFLICEPFEDDAQSMLCDYDYEAGREVQARIDAATERFLALDPATRQAWLEANWDELRAGRLTLDEVP